MRQMQSYCKALILSITLFLGCAPDYEDYSKVFPEAVQYVKSFENDLGHPIEKQPIRLEDIVPQNYAGICRRSGNDWEIVIDKPYWDRAGFFARHQVLYHELGHCYLKRGHRNDRLKDGHPASIMNEYTLNPWYYEDHLGYYLDELFKGVLSLGNKEDSSEAKVECQVFLPR